MGLVEALKFVLISATEFENWPTPSTKSGAFLEIKNLKPKSRSNLFVGQNIFKKSLQNLNWEQFKSNPNF